jgi:uncharacterized OB-fold protein
VSTAAQLPPAELIHLVPDVFTRPFWEAAAEHRLVVPRCTSCGTFRLPPSAHHPVLPDFADSVPYVPIVVELPGTNGCRLIGALQGVDIDDVHIGMDVVLEWRDVREGETVPTFRPASAGSS